MKTNINFYTEDLRPKVYYLTLTNIAIVSGIFLLIMVFWFAQISLSNNQLAKQKQALQNELSSEEEQLVNFQAALIKHNDTTRFTNAKNGLERELAAKKALYKLVSAQSSADAIDYSVVMEELTQHHDHNLWLKDFRFNKNNVTFHGYALESKAVTQWMSYLQATNSFTGREFSLLKINAINTEVLEFNAATTVGDNAQEVGL